MCKQWKTANSECADHTESADAATFVALLTSHLCFAWKLPVWGLNPVFTELTEVTSVARETVD